MPIYEYKSEAGETICIERSMKGPHPSMLLQDETGAVAELFEDGVHDFPEAFTSDGATVFERLFGNHEVNADPVTGRFPVASNALPRWLPGCEHTKDGKPIVTSRAHRQSICSKYGYTHEG